MRIPVFLWFVFIIYSTLFINHVVGAEQCLSDQQSLLINLKNSLIFEPSLSTKLSKWNTSSSSWDGVTCEEGRVTGLDLSNEFISGGINHSSALFSFQYLKTLNLGFNMFNFIEIPYGIGNLRRLENLNLSYAGFGGQVPIALTELTKLTTLDLSMIDPPVMLQLTNPNLKMLVTNLRELRELYLDGVNVSAAGAEWCEALSSSLPKLQVLSMSNCYLSGPIDDSLMNLRNLSVIQLGGNNLSTAVPDFFADFSNLTSLRLAATGLYGQFPERIFTVTSLQELDLSDNLLLYGVLPEFPRGSSLQTVALSFTGFSGLLPNSIGYLQKLSSVELIKCNFSGQIPSSMANLTQLVYLDFSNNGLTGQISSINWESFHNLQLLNLRNNLLEGDIPPSLFTLPLIQSIQLSENRFSGAFYLNRSLNFSSHELETIDLSSNNLEGQLPTELLEFPQLKYVSFSFNNFNGSIHISTIQRMNNIAYLDLSHNSLFIIVDENDTEVRSFPPLSTLRLSSCHLKKLPSLLKNQSRLITLDLSNNEIEGRIPDWFWNLTNLLYLNLSSNFLEGTESPLWNLPSSLKILDLHGNKLQGPMPPVPLLPTYVDYSSNNLNSAIPDNIGPNLSFIIFFSLSKNSLYGSIPGSVCKGGYLQVLDLSSNNLNGSIPACLIMMKSLKVLNLRNNSFTGVIPETFTRICGLKTLDLSSNMLEAKLPRSLKNCNSLEVLDVGHNQIEDVFPCHLQNTTNLHVLVLRSNRFSGQIGCPLVDNSWSFLQIVDVANNRFNAVPPEDSLSTWKAMQDNVDVNNIHYQFLSLSGLYYQDSVAVTIKGSQLELVKILIAFTSIDFSANQINGSIPAAIGNFTALRLLNLSHNLLSGSIPSSLGNMQVLESLDLSTNQLSGTIQSQLTNLNFLSVLNLSNNELVGSIPVGKQFNTFSEDSYRGNIGLCGFPLKRMCDSITAEKPEAGFKDDDDDVVFDSAFFMITAIGFVAAGATTIVVCLVPGRGRWSDNLVDKFVLLVQAIISRQWF